MNSLLPNGKNKSTKNYQRGKVGKLYFLVNIEHVLIMITYEDLISYHIEVKLEKLHP